MEYLVSGAETLHRMLTMISVQMFHCMQLLKLTLVIFLVFIVDQSKEATFKVAPSKWEAVDESELEAQGERPF